MDKRMYVGRGFDHPLKPCDFDKWVKYDSLPIEQACFVLLGFEPYPLEITQAKLSPYFGGKLPSWERPPGFDDALALLKNSIQNGNVQSEPSMVGQYFTRQIQWPALISWAKSKRYTIPPEIEGSVELAVEPMQAHNSAAPVTMEPAPVVPLDVGPVQRSASQDAAILHQIVILGYDPMALPQNKQGKPGVKRAVRDALRENQQFVGVTVFDKAWERLSARGDIVIQK